MIQQHSRFTSDASLLGNIRTLQKIISYLITVAHVTNITHFIACHTFLICTHCRTRASLLFLTHSHTMTPFDGSGKEAFKKHYGKRRNCLYKQFLLFPCFLLYQRQKLSKTQCFLLYQTQKLSFLLHLICHLQRLPIWSGPKFYCVGMKRVWERSLLKTLRKKEKLLVQAISPFPTMFSTLSKTKFFKDTMFSTPFLLYLASANAYNLLWSKILLCGNGLITTETSILKVLHGNTKSPIGSMYSWRYNILLEVKEGILPSFQI